MLSLNRCHLATLTQIVLRHPFAGVPFPKDFMRIAKTILKRLFRVYAHIYHQHFREVVSLGEEAHLNTSFKHFIYFVQVTKYDILCLRHRFSTFKSQGVSPNSNKNDRASFEDFKSKRELFTSVSTVAIRKGLLRGVFLKWGERHDKFIVKTLKKSLK